MPNKILIVGKRQGGQTLAAVLTTALRLSRRDIEFSLKNRWVRLDGAVCRQPGRRVRAGQRLHVVIPRQHPSRGTGLRGPRVKTSPDLPSFARAIRIVHVDEHIIVIDTPAGLTTV